MKRRFCTQSVDCIQQFIRVNAALGLLSANVDLEQSATDSDMLVEQDQVIVRGTDLKDNTVVKT